MITGFDVYTELFHNDYLRNLPPVNLRIQFHLQTNEEDVYPERYPLDLSWLPVISLFPVAHAASCSYTMDEEVIWINITSDADYNDDYPAGTRLNDLVYESSRGLPIDRLLSDFGIRNFRPYSHFSLLIPEPPAQVLEHNFTFEVGLGSGSIITLTEPIDFTSLAAYR